MGKADTHVHTNYSGVASLWKLKFPESVTTPQEQVDQAIHNGMDVLCITDHNETAGAFVAQRYAKDKDIDVIIGEEINTNEGEIIGMYLTEKIKRDLSIEETIDEIRSQGGLTIAPHPFSFHVDGLGEKIFSIDLDGFEVMNGGHPDLYSNVMASKVMERYPGVWAPMSASDGHSRYTVGTCYTEFEGSSAEDLRKAILNKTTVPVGRPAPVISQVQWSIEVVLGGQKLMYESLRGRLKSVEDNTLVDRINEMSNLMKVAAFGGSLLYLFPPVSFLATLMSTAYLKTGAIKMSRDMQKKIEEFDKLIIERFERLGGKAFALPTEIKNRIKCP